MVKEQSFVASFAFSISADVTAGLGGSPTFTKNVLEALSFCEPFSSLKDDFALKLALLYIFILNFCKKANSHIHELCIWLIRHSGKKVLLGEPLCFWGTWFLYSDVFPRYLFPRFRNDDWVHAYVWHQTADREMMHNCSYFRLLLTRISGSTGEELMGTCMNSFRGAPVSHVIKALNWDLDDVSAIPIPILLQTYYLMLRKSS